MIFPLRDYLPHARPPMVTLVLIALNVLVFFAGFGQEQSRSGAASAPKQDLWVYEWGTIPCELFRKCSNQPAQARVTPSQDLFPGEAKRVVQVSVAEHSPWLTILASAFLHGGLLHLAGNMLFLWVYGGNVEDAMSKVTFLGFYLSAAVISALAQSIIQPGSAIPQIGASGAIAGTIGAYLVLYPRARVRSFIFPIPWLFRIPAWLVAGWWGVEQFLATWQSVFVPGAGNNGVAYMAHLAGFAFGLAVIRSVGRASPEYHRLYGGGQPPPQHGYG